MNLVAFLFGQQVLTLSGAALAALLVEKASLFAMMLLVALAQSLMPGMRRRGLFWLVQAVIVSLMFVAVTHDRPDLMLPGLAVFLVAPGFFYEGSFIRRTYLCLLTIFSYVVASSLALVLWSLLTHGAMTFDDVASTQFIGPHVASCLLTGALTCVIQVLTLRYLYSWVPRFEHAHEAASGVLAPRPSTASTVVAWLAFPLSQVFMLAAFMFEALWHALPTWVMVAVAALFFACIAVDLYLMRFLARTKDAWLASERVQLMQALMEGQRARRAQLEKQQAEALQVWAGITGEIEGIAALLAQAAPAAPASASAGEQALSQMRDISSRLHLAQARFCEHRAADTLMAGKASECAEAGVRLETSLAIPAAVGVSGVTLCAVLSNLMDNALHACKKLPTERRWISVKASVVAGTLVIWQRNACLMEGELPFCPSASDSAAPVENAPRGCGLAEHGWGLQIVQALASEDGGMLETERTGERGEEFAATVVLRLRGADASGASERTEGLGL